MTNDQIRMLADEVLRPTFEPYGFDHVEVRFDDNSYGEPAIYVEAHFRKGSEPTPGHATLVASGDLFRAFMARGEQRLPLLTHRFEDDEIAED